MKRRDFLKTGTAVTAIAGCAVKPRRTLKAGPSANKIIEYRSLGRTGFRTTEIGFGCMNMANPELLTAAIDHGINYIDTANRYMNGRNEEIVGQVMKTHRNKVFLTTKIGAVGKLKGISSDTRNAEIMPKLLETSLDRLQTDYVDLLLFHIVDTREEVLNESFMKFFDSVKKKGMCRFVGVSTHLNHAEVVNAAVDSKFWDAVLVGYNYFSPPEVKKSIARAHNAGLAVIAMKNLLRIQMEQPYFVPLPEMPYDKGSGMTEKQALMKWVLDDKNVDVTILGMTSFEHLEEDIAVMGMDFTSDNRRMLRRYAESVSPGTCRGVSGCTKCLRQCPKGVSICDLNRCVAYADSYHLLGAARENYRALPLSSRIEACGSCETCSIKCVNGLDLGRTVRRAKELFA